MSCHKAQQRQDQSKVQETDLFIDSLMRMQILTQVKYKQCNQSFLQQDHL